MHLVFCWNKIVEWKFVSKIVPNIPNDSGGGEVCVCVCVCVCNLNCTLFWSKKQNLLLENGRLCGHKFNSYKYVEVQNNNNILILMSLLIKDNPVSLRCTSAGSLLTRVNFENPKYTVLYWIVSRCGLRHHWGAPPCLFHTLCLVVHASKAMLWCFPPLCLAIAFGDHHCTVRVLFSELLLTTSAT